MAHPFVGEPPVRRRAGHGLEPTSERPRRHVHATCERLDGVPAGEIAANIIEKRVQLRVVRRRVDRNINELLLPAVAVWRDDRSPRHSVGNARSAVTSDEVEAEVKPRGAPSRSEHVALVHVQHIRVNGQRRVGRGELGGECVANSVLNSRAAFRTCSSRARGCGR